VRRVVRRRKKIPGVLPAPETAPAGTKKRAAANSSGSGEPGQGTRGKEERKRGAKTRGGEEGGERGIGDGRREISRELRVETP